MDKLIPFSDGQALCMGAVLWLSLTWRTLVSVSPVSPQGNEGGTPGQVNRQRQESALQAHWGAGSRTKLDSCSSGRGGWDGLKGRHRNTSWAALEVTSTPQLAHTPEDRADTQANPDKLEKLQQQAIAQQESKGNLGLDIKEKKIASPLWAWGNIWRNSLWRPEINWCRQVGANAVVPSCYRKLIYCSLCGRLFSIVQL